MEFILSARSKKQLVIEGKWVFSKKNTYKDSTFWVCVKSDIGCGAKLKYNTYTERIEKITGEHTMPPWKATSFLEG